jgi:uncharacterized protein YggU (UPF0235/DUF167 family)
VLIVRVAAPAVDGRATEAARRALAEAMGVSPRHVTLRRGAASRSKVFEIEGGRHERLRELLEQT